jgi:hypothetical protein
MMAECMERRPHVEDLALVRAALEKARVPVTDPLLDFHRVFAGYVIDAYGDEGILGLIHREVCIQSAVRPMAVTAYRSRKDGSWSVACADLHASYEMFLKPDGTFFANGPVASSYFMYTEQNALAWEFAQRRSARRIQLDARAKEEINRTLLPRLAGRRVEELSDAVSRVFVTEELVVILRGNGYHQGWVAAGCDPVELRGFEPHQRRKKYPQG